MMSAMINCVPSLLWAGGLVIMLIFVFSIMFTQFVVGFLRDTPVNERDPDLLAALKQYYGGFGLTLLSLFMAISGGADWRDVQQPLSDIDSLVGFLYLAYI